MKNFICLIISVILIFTSCNNNEEQLLLLKKQNKELLENSSIKDSLIIDYFKSVDEIQQNLSRITLAENTINLNLQNGIENKKSKKDFIINEIQFINTLLENNKVKINELNQKLSNSRVNIVELQNILDRLQEQLLNKDHEVINLKNQLVKKDFELDVLNNSLDSLTLLSIIQEELIFIQEDELNTAYFCYGTKKELKKNGVLTNEFMKSKKVSDDFNKNYFEKIDITKTYSIPLAVKKAELITIHPTGSYKFIENKTIEKLVITNPKEFWEASKYLVIVVE